MSASSPSKKSKTDVTPVEIIPGRLYFVSTDSIDKADSKVYITADGTLRYEPFFSDFGPYNLAQVYKFCKFLHQYIHDPKLAGKKLYYYTKPVDQHQVNTVWLLGAYLILYMNKSADEVAAQFAHLNLMQFVDASAPQQPGYELHVTHCFRAWEKARQLQFFDFSTFNVQEYEFYEIPENGDFNMIVPNKFLAFSGPTRTMYSDGYPTLTPQFYVPLFKKLNVSTVIRLNTKCYDKVHFTDAGIEHHDLFFVDGSTPSVVLLDHFIEICERAKGVVAVHCKAGLGRTGTMIACYMMKHYNITAEEAVAWIRVCRPGSVIGPQYAFICSQQQRLWQAGRQYRQNNNLPEPFEPTISRSASMDRIEQKGETQSPKRTTSKSRLDTGAKRPKTDLVRPKNSVKMLLQSLTSQDDTLVAEVPVLRSRERVARPKARRSAKSTAPPKTKKKLAPSPPPPTERSVTFSSSTASRRNKSPSMSRIRKSESASSWSVVGFDDAKDISMSEGLVLETQGDLLRKMKAAHTPEMPVARRGRVR